MFAEHPFVNEMHLDVSAEALWACHVAPDGGAGESSEINAQTVQFKPIEVSHTLKHGQTFAASPAIELISYQVAGERRRRSLSYKRS